jgi:hypothetical protein
MLLNKFWVMIEEILVPRILKESLQEMVDSPLSV